MTARNRLTHRHVGFTPSAAVAGVKRSRKTAFIEADVLPWSAKYVCTFVHNVSTGPSKPNLLGVKVLQ